MKILFVFVLVLFIPFFTFSNAWEDIKSGSSYVWSSVKYFVSTKEGYRAVEDLYLIDDLDQCATAVIGKILPKDSTFQIPTPSEKYKISDTEFIIKVTYVGGPTPNPTLTDTLQRLCIGKVSQANLNLAATPRYVNQNLKYRYRRIGGMTTGLLVVPFKWRKNGDAFSGEATVGPYVGLKNEFFTLALTAGLSQIGTTEKGSEEIKYETGFSLATGFIFKVSKDFDIALVVGKDHLFGSVGDGYEHQNGTWYSFGIGYKFGD